MIEYLNKQSSYDHQVIEQYFELLKGTNNITKKYLDACKKKTLIFKNNRIDRGEKNRKSSIFKFLKF
jgi:hypothetical protein